jgi:hypothetical protein
MPAPIYPRGEKPAVFARQEAERASEAVWTLWRAETSLGAAVLPVLLPTAAPILCV